MGLELVHFRLSPDLNTGTTLASFKHVRKKPFSKHALNSKHSAGASNKHVHDHNTTGIAQVSIRNRFRPCLRDSSGGRTTRKPNQAMHRRRTKLANRHHA